MHNITELSPQPRESFTRQLQTAIQNIDPPQLAQKLDDTTLISKIKKRKEKLLIRVAEKITKAITTEVEELNAYNLLGTYTKPSPYRDAIAINIAQQLGWTDQQPPIVHDQSHVVSPTIWSFYPLPKAREVKSVATDTIFLPCLICCQIVDDQGVPNNQTAETFWNIALVAQNHLNSLQTEASLTTQ